MTLLLTLSLISIYGVGMIFALSILIMAMTLSQDPSGKNPRSPFSVKLYKIAVVLFWPIILGLFIFKNKRHEQYVLSIQKYFGSF